MPPWKTAAVCVCASVPAGAVEVPSLWHLHSFTCVSCSRDRAHSSSAGSRDSPGSTARAVLAVSVSIHGICSLLHPILLLPTLTPGTNGKNKLPHYTNKQRRRGRNSYYSFRYRESDQLSPKNSYNRINTLNGPKKGSKDTKLFVLNY